MKVSKKVYQERFQNLLRVLDEVQASQKPFNMDDWTSQVKIIEYMDEVPVGESCGTSACTVGWCCQDPWFINQGLVLCQSDPWYDGEYGWDAVSVFFGINEKANFLFDGAEYVPTEDWYETHEEIYQPSVAEVRLRIHKYMTKRFGKDLV